MTIENSLVSFVRHPTKPFELPKEFELPWLDPKQPYPAYGMDQDVAEKPYEQTIASIISETNDNDTDVFITEKLWKAVLMKHVFVVHGNYQYLKKIKELGFKTFDGIIDEGYDKITNLYSRVDRIASLIDNLTHDPEVPQQILDHNYDVMMNTDWQDTKSMKTLFEDALAKSD